MLNEFLDKGDLIVYTEGRNFLGRITTPMDQEHARRTMWLS